MTTKWLTGHQTRWWEKLSGYILNIVYRVCKKNLANASSHWQNYASAPEGCCAATILTMCSDVALCPRQLDAATIQDDEVFKDVSPDTFADLILEC
jgi:hypothetical protein